MSEEGQSWVERRMARRLAAEAAEAESGPPRGWSDMTLLGKSLVAAVPLLLIGWCSVETAKNAQETDRLEGLPKDSLTQASIAFQGMPDKSEIQDALDNALNATGMPITDENYGRAASVLITFRKEHGFSEMDQLECIPTRVTDPRLPALNFGNVAAVCITDMVSGLYVPN